MDVDGGPFRVMVKFIMHTAVCNFITYVGVSVEVTGTRVINIKQGIITPN